MPRSAKGSRPPPIGLLAGRLNMMSPTTSQSEGTEPSTAEAVGAMRERLEAVAKLNADKPNLWKCPRCDYDLRGQYDASGGKANGRCSECGLDVDWLSLLERDQQVLKGFIEHSKGRWLTLATAWVTLSWLVWPAMFWRRVSIERPMNIRRAWLWLVVVLCTPRIIAGILFASVLFIETALPSISLFNLTAENLLTVFLAELGNRSWGGVSIWSFRSWPPSVLALLASSVAAVVILLVIPHTLGKAKVRRRHIVRASIYSLGWLIPLSALSVMRVALWIVGSGRARGRSSWRGWSNFVVDIIYGLREMWPLWSVILLVWFGAYWWYVLSRGWRLPTPKRIWLALMLASLPAGVIAFLVQGSGIGAIAEWLY